MSNFENLFFCVGYHENVFLTKEEVEFIHSQKWPIEIIKGVGIVIVSKHKPFKKYIHARYNRRLEMKENGDERQYNEKIALNSLYGKFLQNINILRLHREFTRLQENELKKELIRLKQDKKDYVLHRIKHGEFCIFLRESRKGILHNPLYISLITQWPRIELLKLAYANMDDTIMFNTDSITLTKPLTEIPISKKIGEWDIVTNGSKAVILNTGIYQYYGDGFNYQKLRGGYSQDERLDTPETLITKAKDLRERLRTDKNYFTLTFRRMPHLKESLRNHKLMEINILKKIEKKIMINNNTKRIWERDFKDGFDALENNRKSKPFDRSDLDV